MQEQKITTEGQPCRKCGTPVIRKSHDVEHPIDWSRKYHFEWWFKCPNPSCRISKTGRPATTIYLVPDAIVYHV